MIRQEEYGELLFLNRRLLTFTELVGSVKDNSKSLKYCEKLIKTELTCLKKSTLSQEAVEALKWRYTDFTDIVKRLKKSKDASVYGKAVSDLNDLVRKTAEVIVNLEEKLDRRSDGKDAAADEGVIAGAKELASKLGSVAKKVAGKVSDGAKIVSETVGEKVEKIKKMLAADESRE